MNLLLALASAVLLVLSFPGADLAMLAPVALAPLLIAALREERPRQRFLIGWAAGIVYWFGVCYWIEFVLAVHGGLGHAGGWAVFVLFCLAKGLHLAVFTLLAGVLMRAWWAAPAVAALWTAIEATHGMAGFTWLALGNAAIDMGVPLRVAPYTGVHGASFLFALMGAVLALAVLRRPRIEMAWIGLLAITLVLPKLPDAARGQATAVMVQPNISETEDWTRTKLDAQIEGLARQSLTVALAANGKAPRVIVWPEVPAPFYYDTDGIFRGAVNELARSARAYVLAGVVAHTATGAPLNSAQLVSPEGQAVSRYDKVNLVPFGEYVPWPFGFARKITGEIGDFEPGSRVVVLPIDDHRAGSFICYEAAFPNYVRQFAAGGAEVFFNVSNDGYFGHTAARAQHLKLVRMRAAENRRWILRATNDGITATIDSAGRLRGSLPPYTQAASYTGFSYVAEQTFYTRWGDWFAILCGVMAVVLLLTARASGV